MKTKSLDNVVCFEPENTYDAFRLGRLYEMFGKGAWGVGYESKQGERVGLCRIRTEPSELVDSLIALKDKGAADG